MIQGEAEGAQEGKALSFIFVVSQAWKAAQPWSKLNFVLADGSYTVNTNSPIQAHQSYL